MDILCKSYIAGIVDGEGSIRIGKGIIGNYIYYSLKISVEMSNKKVPNYILSKVGYGNIRKRTRVNKNTGKIYKPSYEWYITGNNALCFIKEIYKYLIQKKEEAYIAIKFQKTVNNYHKRNKKGVFMKSIDDNTQDKRKIFYDKLKNIHHS